jgi:hypothetical protein
MEQPEIIKPWFNASSNDGSSCVDVQFLADGGVQVRHSKKVDAEVITYDATEWDAFIAGAKAGSFDRPDA